MGPTHNNQNGLGGPKKGGSVKITTRVPDTREFVPFEFNPCYSNLNSIRETERKTHFRLSFLLACKKQIIWFCIVYVRTKSMPDFRDTELKETQKEWVATTLNSFVNCEFSKISPEILSDWETLLSKTSEGNVLGQCLRGKYFLNYTHFLIPCVSGQGCCLAYGKWKSMKPKRNGSQPLWKVLSLVHFPNYLLISWTTGKR